MQVKKAKTTDPRALQFMALKAKVAKFTNANTMREKKEDQMQREWK